MKKTIVILHGWGSTLSGQRYTATKKILEKKGYTVFTPDLPGFGENTLKKNEIFFEDYVAFVKKFLDTKKLKKVILIGHSFGGRVAIHFAAQYPKYISSLILTGASGIPHPLPSLKKKIVFYTTKIIRPLFGLPPFSWVYQGFRKLVYYSIGEMDYYSSGNLAKTFQNVYRVSIVDDLEKIHVPTLLIWGENDTITPLSDGEFIQRRISGSQFIIVPHASHKLPYENPPAFTKPIIRFLS